MMALHSHTHPSNIGELSIDAQLKEFVLNKEIIEYITNTATIAATYPCGRYSEDTIDVLIDLDVEYGFLCHENDDSTRYTLGRLDCSNVQLGGR